MRLPQHLAVVILSLGVSAAIAQRADPQPYASIDPATISYSGPDREAPRDLAGRDIKIGLIAPLQGARKLEGDGLVAAAQMAIEDESAAPLAGGQHLKLVVRDETGLWGRASSEIVKLAVEDRAVALITSSDGRAAHLSEQVGNRLGVPVVTLASDATTTQINIPWIFRIVPNDAAQAGAFAENIYRERGFKRVLLISEGDHDGREGAAAFVKAAQKLGAAPPEQVTIASPTADLTPLGIAARARDAQAVIIWVSAALATRVLEEIAEVSAPAFICRKALEGPLMSALRGRQNIWVAASINPSAENARRAFAERFQARTGFKPSPAAAEVYDAVRLIAQSLRQSGPNRARLRDALAARAVYPGVSGIINFDGAGNNRAAIALVPLHE
jgi:branched-chain amino acid transport system substrate-binding protein